MFRNPKMAEIWTNSALELSQSITTIQDRMATELGQKHRLLSSLRTTADINSKLVESVALEGAHIAGILAARRAFGTNDISKTSINSVAYNNSLDRLSSVFDDAAHADPINDVISTIREGFISTRDEIYRVGTEQTSGDNVSQVGSNYQTDFDQWALLVFASFDKLATIQDIIVDDLEERSSTIEEEGNTAIALSLLALTIAGLSVI